MTSTRTHSLQIDTGPGAKGGDRWEEHFHDEHELLWASTHRLTVITPELVHLVPRGASVWIPAGVMHEVHAPPGNRMRCTWFTHAGVPAGLDRTTVLVTPPLLTHVLTYVMEGVLSDPERERAEVFALDVLWQSPRLAVDIAQPRSPWLRDVAAELIADPSNGLSTQEWAARSAVGLRTFSRHFLAETGMTFARWRAELRHRTAMQLLASGASVRTAAIAVGFDSASSFTTAFRRQTGSTPAAFAQSATKMAE